VKRYADRPESDSPLLAERTRAAELLIQQRELLAALPAVKRPAAKLVLTLAAQRIPLRGIAKRSFLQAIDAARAAARRVGEALAADGVIADPADIFMLTAQELQAAGSDGSLSGLVERRRATRVAYQALEFAATEWQGLPEAVADADSEAVAASGPVAVSRVLTGTGVSSGCVEGFVRVVTDPSFTDVEPEEVLVAPTTDPSWSSIMFISSALVVDMGGALSHAAVVARELRIPCVVGTRTGTRELHTGDWVRVDGTAGTVEILARGGERGG
jgi:phosphohistidine swiveling domain-containing protein